MKKIIFIFIIISSYFQIFTLKSYSQSNWFWQNPLPYGNDLHAIQFIDENTGYASGGGFAILKTTSGGLNWFNVARIDSIPSGNNPGYFNNLFFDNAETGYVGGNGFYKTTNGGDSWIYLNSLISINSFSFPDQNTGYIINDNSLVKTTNGGFNCFFIPFDNLNSRLQKIFFTSRDTGFIISRQSSNPIFKTVNGGVNWTVCFSSGDAHNGIYFCDNNTGFVAGAREILKTTNGGTNWNYIYHGYFNTFTNTYFINPNTGFVTYYYPHKIIKTTNSGISWDTLLPGPQLNGFSFYNETTGFIACEGGEILKTTNSGSNWNCISYNVATETLNKVFFINETTGFISGNNNTLLKTTNKGLIWTKDSTGFFDNYVYIKFFNEFSGIMQGANILKTTDGGQTWDSVAHFESINTFEAMNIDTLYFTREGSLYKSFDGGNTWNISFVDEHLNGFYFSKNNNDTGYAVLNFEQICQTCQSSTQILKTTTNGLNWNVISIIGLSLFKNIIFTSNLTGFISGQFGIQRTVNGGINWSNSYLNYSSPLYVYNKNIIYTYDGFGNILKTTNGGINWIIILSNGGSISSFFFTQANTGYLTGNYGKILKTTNGGGIIVDIGPLAESTLNNYNLYQNYPNPFNPITKIKFSLPQDGNVQLFIYDVLGREIMKLVNNEFKNAGNFTVEVDGLNLSSGIYFYRLEAGEFVQTKRMVLIK